MTDQNTVLRLKLYVAGQTPRAERALLHLRELVEAQEGLTVDLSVIDVLERPDLAEDALILATPTLVKEAPAPTRRLIGDLSDSEKVLRGLHLSLPDPPGVGSIASTE